MDRLSLSTQRRDRNELQPAPEIARPTLPPGGLGNVFFLAPLRAARAAAAERMRRLADADTRPCDSEP